MSILDRLEGSFWIKLIAGVVFVLGLHYDAKVEIQETHAQMIEKIDEKYVRKDYLKFLIDDVKEIKFLIQHKVIKNEMVEKALYQKAEKTSL